MQALFVHNSAVKKNKEWEQQINSFVRSFRHLGVEMLIVDNSKALDFTNRFFDYLSFVFMWDSDASLAEAIERRGLPVFNSSRAIRASNDRALTHFILNQKFVPTTKMVVPPFLESGDTLANFARIKELIAEEKLTYPFVVKERYINKNEQFYLAANELYLKRIMQHLRQKEIVLEEFIPEGRGRSYRLIALNSKCLCGAEKIFEGNFNRYPHRNIVMGSVANIPRRMKKIAVMATKALGCTYAGVDVVVDDLGNYLVTEVNARPRTTLMETVSHAKICLKIANECKINFRLQKRMIKR